MFCGSNCVLLRVACSPRPLRALRERRAHRRVWLWCPLVCLMLPAPRGPRRFNRLRWCGDQGHRGRPGRCCRRVGQFRRRFRRLRRLLSPPSAAAIAYAGGGIEISVAGPPPPPHPCQCFSSTTGGFGSLRFWSLPSLCSVECRFSERPPAAASARRTSAAGGRFLRLEGPEFGARLIIILKNVFVRE